MHENIRLDFARLCDLVSTSIREAECRADMNEFDNARCSLAVAIQHLRHAQMAMEVQKMIRAFK